MRGLRESGHPEARVIIETRPGEERQVDYGTGPMVRDPDGQVPAHAAVRVDAGLQSQVGPAAVFRSSARTWAELHEKAFRRLGGTTRIVVLDILREGVLSADIYDPR